MSLVKESSGLKANRESSVSMFSSVRTRLLLAFAIVALLALGIGAIAVFSQDQILEKQNQIKDEVLPAMKSAREVQEISLSIVAIGPQIIAAKNQEEREAAIAPLQTLEEEALKVAALLDAAKPEASSGPESNKPDSGEQPEDTEATLAEMISLTAKTLHEMESVAEQLEQVRKDYEKHVNDAHGAIFFVESRSNFLFDGTQRDAKNAVDRTSRFINKLDPEAPTSDQAGNVKRGGIQLEKTSKEGMDIIRWCYDVATLASGMRSNIDALALVKTPEDALKAGVGLMEQLAMLQLFQSTAVLAEHGKLIESEYVKLEDKLNLGTPTSLAEIRAEILRQEDKLRQLQVANETTSSQLNNAVKTALLKETDAIENEIVSVGKVIGQSGQIVKVASAAALVISLLIGLLYVHLGLLRRLVTLNTTMARLAEGDTNVTVSLKKKDEITRMARAVQVFKDNMIQSRNMRMELAKDFDEKINGLLANSSMMVEKMQDAAGSMHQSASDATEQSKSAQDAVLSATDSVNLVSEATRQMVESIQEIEAKMVESEREVSSMVDQANKSQEILKNLSTAASRIEEVVKVITDIAEKTNLLSLNASIEAARAGDSGRGFAVVANEVKDLASNTAKFTEEIRGTVSEMQSTSSTAAEEIARIIQRVSIIETGISTVASAVVQQAAVTQEIGNNTQEVVSAMQIMDNSMSTLSQAVGSSEERSAEVDDFSQQLAVQTEQIRTEATEFVRSMTSSSRGAKSRQAS